MRSDKEGTRFNYMSPIDPKVESEIAKPQVMPEDGLPILSHIAQSFRFG